MPPLPVPPPGPLFPPFLPHLAFSPQVAEMRGGMAVLSDAATGTTILLALPMGGREDSGSRAGNEGKGEVGKTGGTMGGRTFPQAEVERAGAGGEGVREAEAVVRGVVTGRGVAVVDDNAVNRMVARRTLQGYGAHVLLLSSGEEALQALSSATPSPPIHLLLLDLHMPPGIDGSVPCSPSHLFSVLLPACMLVISTCNC
ncbi:unnamed protein product [Closterium sp. Naga37s-1]|nr:unnamed protein product [Closterium sp. Naga37s-1]